MTSPGQRPGPTVFMAGGGTGGHVFPLVAVAHALVRRCPEIRPVFIGTSRGMETKFVPAQGFELELLDVLPLRGGGIGGAVRGALRAAQLLPESRALIKKYAPRAVFSIGGYAAGPISLAARSMGLPVALMEPNSVVGLANLLIAPFVRRAYTAFPEAEKRFSPAVVLRSGVPLRPGFTPRPWAPSDGPTRVLVLGGSQGAKSLNELVPQAFAQLGLPLSVVHQCGSAHGEVVKQRYRQLGVDFAHVVPFIDDMPQALADADLVVGRSGASAVSEMAAVGRPGLLIPYPHASGDHQRINAQSLARVGAAVCVSHQELSVARLTSELRSLCQDREKLRKMAQASRDQGAPDAADTIARDFLSLAGVAAQRTTSVETTVSSPATS